MWIFPAENYDVDMNIFATCAVLKHSECVSQTSGAPLSRVSRCYKIRYDDSKM